MKYISIPSRQDYEMYGKDIPALSQWWWLRTPGYLPDCVRQIKNPGDQMLNGPHCSSVRGVRPVAILQFEPTDKEFWIRRKMPPGSKIHYGLWNWTVLDEFDDCLTVLCDHVIARYPFDLKTNEWNSSFLKHWLETHGDNVIRLYDIESMGDIESIGLLTKKEYNKYRKYIADLSVAWWLSSSEGECAHYVYTDYERRVLINRDGKDVRYSVRPVITIKLDESVKSLPGFAVSIFGLVFNYGKYTWTVLNYDSNTNTILALCDSTIAKRVFDLETSVWEKSELKQWLEADGKNKITKRK